MPVETTEPTDETFEDPTEDSSEETPADESTDESPVEEETTDEEPTDEIPVDEETPTDEDTPAEEPTDETPVDEESPADEETPVAEPTDEIPVEDETTDDNEPGPFQPVDSSETPVAEPTDEIPVEDETTDDNEPGPFQPVDSSETRVAEPTEETPVEDETTDDNEPGPFQPVDSSDDGDGTDLPFSEPVSQPTTGSGSVEPLEPAWLSQLTPGPLTLNEKAPLTIIPEPTPAERKAPFTISFRYDPSVSLPPKPLPETVAKVCAAMEQLRNDVGVVAGLDPQVPSIQLATDPPYWQRGYMRNAHTAKPDTNLDPAAALKQVGLAAGPAGPKGTVDELVKLWRTLSGVEGDCAAINAYDNANLTWGTGFAAAGHGQSAIRRALKMNEDLRRLLHAAGMTVQPVQVAKNKTKLMFFAVDTTEGWVLKDNDAERYIRNDRRLLTLLIRVAEGTVPDALLPDTPADRNQAMRWASANAQFIEFIADGSAGHVLPPAWGPGWSPELRAGVAHNIHFGAVPTDWTRYAATGGDPFKIIQEMVWGSSLPKQIRKSANARFNGHFGHRGFLSALPMFAPQSPTDPPDSRYIDIKGLGTLLVPPLKPKP